jgi:hypothetical protein
MAKTSAADVFHNDKMLHSQEHRLTEPENETVVRAIGEGIVEDECEEIP